MTDSPTAYGSYVREEQHAFPDERLHAVLDALEEDERVQAYLQAQNVNPVTRLGYNDHGEKHIEIVLDRALGLYDLLKTADVLFNGASEQGLAEADEPVIIALAATLHDIGHVIHRTNHAHWAIPLCVPLLDDLLEAFYSPADAVRVKGEVLHAIICHHTGEHPLTREAGVVRIADGLDMERGRSRRPYEDGGRGINTVSSQAIETVQLYPGESVPVRVEIEMVNAAGVYQVDTLLQQKLQDSRLAELVRIVAVNVDESDGGIVERLEL